MNGRPMAKDVEWGVVDGTLWIDLLGNNNVTIVGFLGEPVQARAGAGALGGVAEDYLEALLTYLAVVIVVSLILGLGLGYTKNESSHRGTN